jgi:hypothetical protein
MLHVGSDLDRKRVDVCLSSDQGCASERPARWFRGRASVLARAVDMVGAFHSWGSRRRAHPDARSPHIYARDAGRCRLKRRRADVQIKGLT